jgi:hypothetical protein
MNYLPISDPAQLQLLEGLMRMLLHGVLVAMAGAALILLCLCLSEVRLPGRRAPEAEERRWSRSGDPLPATRRRAALDNLTPVRLWDRAADVSGGCLSAQTTPAFWLDWKEAWWGEPVEAR